MDILQNTKITKIICSTWDIIKIHLERGCKGEKNLSMRSNYQLQLQGELKRRNIFFKTPKQHNQTRRGNVKLTFGKQVLCSKFTWFQTLRHSCFHQYHWLTNCRWGIPTLQQKGRIIEQVLEKRKKSHGISEFLHELFPCPADAGVSSVQILMDSNRKNNQLLFSSRSSFFPSELEDCHWHLPSY